MAYNKKPSITCRKSLASVLNTYVQSMSIYVNYTLYIVSMNQQSLILRFCPYWSFLSLSSSNDSFKVKKGLCCLLAYREEETEGEERREGDVDALVATFGGILRGFSPFLFLINMAACRQTQLRQLKHSYILSHYSKSVQESIHTMSTLQN